MSDAASGERIRQFGRAFSALATELDRAITQDTRPKHLWVSGYRCGAQAGRLMLELVEHFPTAKWSGPKGAAAVLKRPIHDGNAWLYWKLFVVPWLKAKFPSRLKPEAGTYDWPMLKVDSEGRPLGHDGAPLQQVNYTDADTGQRGWKLNGEIATVVDDYDEVDAMKHLRLWAGDYVDAMRLVAETLETNLDKDDKNSDDSSNQRDIKKRLARLEQDKDKPKSQRELIREQRNNFSAPRRKKSEPWSKITEEYCKKYPKDKKANRGTLRLSFTRNEPKD